MIPEALSGVAQVEPNHMTAERRVQEYWYRENFWIRVMERRKQTEEQELKKCMQRFSWLFVAYKAAHVQEDTSQGQTTEERTTKKMWAEQWPELLQCLGQSEFYTAIWLDLIYFSGYSVETPEGYTWAVWYCILLRLKLY